jgi:hypothetical protein
MWARDDATPEYDRRASPDVAMRAGHAHRLIMAKVAAPAWL